MQHLKMMYHPAMKEVKFQKFQNGREVTIEQSSKLTLYMNEKGKFVLQDKGIDFLVDIAESFDAEKTVEIKVVTTEIDYGDFRQMVNYYNDNRGSKAKIDINLLTELPDMEEMFRSVKKHGEDSLTILKTHKANLEQILYRSKNCPDSIKKCVNNFSADIKKEIDNITGKIESISNKNINLCFVGVYSAGKSALINAIIGYAILPENIKSETARIFKIQSPEKGKSVRIHFYIGNVFTEIVWNSQEKKFEFTTGPSENTTRKAVQEAINANDKKAQHIQLQEILRVLNKKEILDVSTKIDVYFPIPLDNERLQFTIYDTPGTDSNFDAHKDVLKEALSDQTHSILIIVASNDKIEGEGSNALLNYINDAVNKDSKTSIDIGRSLLVINKSDSITLEDRMDLQNSGIINKDNPDLSIKVEDKKLFFVSARYGYVAAAVKNGVAEGTTAKRFNLSYETIIDSDLGRYFLQNRSGKSEITTERMLESSNRALDEAIKRGDKAEVFHICSGLFALEKEIILYGDKFAAAVRAYAIIDSVEKALRSMEKQASMWKSDNAENIEAVEKEIANVSKIIISSIDKAYETYALPQGQPLPDDLLRYLHFDFKSIENILAGEHVSSIEKLFKKFLLFFHHETNAEHKRKIENDIRGILEDYERDFSERRKRSLEEKRDSFVSDVKNAIKANKGISEEARNFILNIDLPAIPQIPATSGIKQLYDRNIQKRDSYLFGNMKHLIKMNLWMSLNLIC